MLGKECFDRLLRVGEESLQQSPQDCHHLSESPLAGAVVDELEIFFFCETVFCTKYMSSEAQHPDTNRCFAWLTSQMEEPGD